MTSIAVFAVAPAVLVLAILAASFVRGPFLYDFKGGLYAAGHDVLHGHNPYRPSQIGHEAEVKRAGGEPQTVISVPVYPAPALVAAAPFALLPYRLAGVLFAALSAGGLVLALRLLGVLDWRCYGLAFASWPVVHGLMLGALTPLIVLGAALAWRCRGRVGSAAAVAALVAAKLYPWTLAAWLLLTRRWRQAALAVGLAAVVIVAGWSAIGFAGFGDYPRMLSDLAYVSQGVSVSLVAGLMAVGVSATLARAAALLAAGGLLLGGLSVARGPDGDRRAFGLAIVAALVASPIVWPHYLALLLVPIALASPRLSPLWFVPLVAYLAPVAQTEHRPWATVPYLAMCGAVVGVELRDQAVVLYERVRSRRRASYEAAQ